MFYGRFLRISAKEDTHRFPTLHVIKPTFGWKIWKYHQSHSWVYWKNSNIYLLCARKSLGNACIALRLCISSKEIFSESGQAASRVSELPLKAIHSPRSQSSWVLNVNNHSSRIRDPEGVTGQQEGLFYHEIYFLKHDFLEINPSIPECETSDFCEK